MSQGFRLFVSVIPENGSRHHCTNLPLIIHALTPRPSHLFSTPIKNKLFSLLPHQQHRILELEVVIGSMPNESGQIILCSLRFLPDRLSFPLVSVRTLDQ